MTRIVRHPTLAVGHPTAGTPLTRLVHLHVWAGVRVKTWGVRREFHLHAVTAPSRLGEWRNIDLARRPLFRVEEREPPLPNGIEAEVGRFLSRTRVVMLRSPSLGLVSEPDEPADAFRRRVMSHLRPAVQRELDELRHARPPVVPWRRRAWRERLARSREELAAAVQAAVDDLERTDLALSEAGTCRAEVGWLLLPPGFEPGLAAPARDLMLTGPVRGGRR